MKANRARWPIATMARLLEVSTSGYYAWLVREPSRRVCSDAQLLAHIRTLHASSRGTYGAPRIHAQLAHEGVHVGRKRVARLMRIAGLCGASRRRRPRTTRQRAGARRAPDLVRRHFSADAANVLWVADATYIPTDEGFLYLAVVLDVFSRRIVGWAMETHLRTELVLKALNMALGQRRPAAVIHHSDHGCQGEFKRPSQHLDRGSCDGYSKAPFRSMPASTVAVTWSASGSTAGELSAVLGSDCGRPFNRARCYRCRSVARRGWPLVPEGRRHVTVTFFAVIKTCIRPLSIVCRARRDRHLAGSGAWRSRYCPQAWAGPFDDFTRIAPQRGDTQRRTGISRHHRAMAC
jgi:transposase InsO family protein